MSVKLGWKNEKLVKTLYFTDLSVNECFRIVNGRGAVYRKVVLNNDVQVINRLHGSTVLLMMEEATGKVFNPTASPVERVEVEVNINVPKPFIY